MPEDAPLLASEANRGMFDRLARRYDLFNTLLSLGLDHLWRRRAVAALGPRDGERYLDVGCGTGGVALAVLRQAPGAWVFGLDPSPEMLAVAARKARRAGRRGRLALTIGDACALPFHDAAFAGVTSAFALRSLPCRIRAFREMHRVLAPGGRLALLELTVPPQPLLRAGHWFHTRTLGALLARLLHGTGGPHRFLCQSIARFPARAIAGELAAAGFDSVRVQTLTAGAATLYTGRQAEV